MRKVVNFRLKSRKILENWHSLKNDAQPSAFKLRFREFTVSANSFSKEITLKTYPCKRVRMGAA